MIRCNADDMVFQFYFLQHVPDEVCVNSGDKLSFQDEVPVVAGFIRTFDVYVETVKEGQSF